jgi:hypothetical protein
MRVPFSPDPPQHLLLVMFLMIAILTGVRWNLSVALNCISFIGRDGEHFFHVLLNHLDFFLRKSSVYSVAHFFIGSLIFGEVSFLSFPYILIVICLMYI